MEPNAQCLPSVSVPASGSFRVRDPLSALSHFAGFLLALIGTFPLLTKAAWTGCTVGEMLSLCAFMAGMIALYGASAAYHTFDLEERGRLRLKRLDHTMIYALIVGSYLPVCVFSIWDVGGRELAVGVSLVAVLGICFSLFWINCPKWLSSAVYLLLGWMSVSALPQLVTYLPRGALVLLVTGGVLYTIGGVIYALKLPGLKERFPGFGEHELFHLFVLGGTACHYAMVFHYLVV
ncbi:MAG: hemolysin III family protein [Oscillospiraceae bacterium]|nr:hemolysin III family protein [Oscillospiraceae bacterium]